MTEETILIGLIIFLAAFNQGLTGFGFAITSIPLLSLIIDIKEAIPIAALCGMFLNVYLTIQLRKSIKFDDIKLLILGSAFGIPVGAYFLSTADPFIVEKILAAIILSFVLLNSTNFIKPSGIENKWGPLFGFASGILGGAFNTNGPPILIYLYLKDWNKYKQKATITGFFYFCIGFDCEFSCYYRGDNFTGAH
ncbi:MAG: sulfite exporter TauE/SafE family protein [Melioribacteraceae bacterium]|nr:sulfite exporter TauE/SafE family protein [Melioribacteraceae bacterium]